jgi:thioredoxin 1
MKKILMFTATCCGPCQAAKPAFNALKESTYSVECELVDIDENKALATQFNIIAVPTFVLLQGGNEVARKSGGMSLEKLQAFINQ